LQPSVSAKLKVVKESVSNPYFEAMSAITHSSFSRPKWRTIVLATLAIWLGGSLLLDGVVMPSLYGAGMMTQPGFASAGYRLFELFNHFELLCAATVLTGILVLNTLSDSAHRWQVAAAFSLLAIGLVYLYGLTPEMSALGLELDWPASTAEIPATMNQLHSAYWLLEIVKLGLGSALLAACYKK
jgi:Domain of unknown function (DUF4149)